MFKEFAGKAVVRYLLAGLILTAALVAMVFLLKTKKVEQVAKTPAPLPVVAYYPVPKILGPDNAPIKVVEYSDFECPSCKNSVGVIQTLLKAYPGKIQIVYHHFPLKSHKWSPHAHQAAECMHIQGKFWPYHDMLYAKQQEWAPSTVPPVERLVQYARDCGANMENFTSCMADANVTRGILAEKEEGSKLQVNATPTFILGEQRFVGPQEMLGRGQNAIRKILGMAPLPLPAAASGKGAAPAPAAPKPSAPDAKKNGAPAKP